MLPLRCTTDISPGDMVIVVDVDIHMAVIDVVIALMIIPPAVVIIVMPIIMMIVMVMIVVVVVIVMMVIIPIQTAEQGIGRRDTNTKPDS